MNETLSAKLIVADDNLMFIEDQDSKKPLSGKHKHIYNTSGFLAGQSKYYLVEDNVEENGTIKPMMAIGEIGKGLITPYFHYISEYGLVSGESDLFLAETIKDLSISQRIYSIERNKKTPAFEAVIYENGFIRNYSKYFAGKINKKWGLFNGEDALDGKIIPIGGWFTEIYDFSPILYGTSNIFIARHEESCLVLQKTNNTVSLALDGQFNNVYVIVIDKKGKIERAVVEMNDQLLVIDDKNNIEYETHGEQDALYKTVQTIHESKVYEYAYNKDFHFYSNIFIRMWLFGKSEIK
ncbi:MAG TPA: hypothetical protein ENO30_06970 [Thermodesulfobium narugense]|nr:hypothetical protein [Thermodesulfobium narugense]